MEFCTFPNRASDAPDRKGGHPQTHLGKFTGTL
jgi:hypothetical protein